MRNKLIMLLFMAKDSLILSLVVFIVLILLKKLLKKPLDRKKLALNYCFIFYICVLLEVTGIIGVFRMTQYKIEWFRDSFQNIMPVIPNNTGEIKMILCNIVLFLPFGFLIKVCINKLKAINVLLISCGFVLIIEMIQAAGGRMFETNDIIANVVGAMLGYGLYCLCKKIKR